MCSSPPTALPNADATRRPLAYIDVSKFLVSYCPTDQNVADGGTKALNRIKQFESAQRLLGLPDLDQRQQHL